MILNEDIRKGLNEIADVYQAQMSVHELNMQKSSEKGDISNRCKMITKWRKFLHIHTYNGQWDNDDSEITIYNSRNAFIFWNHLHENDKTTMIQKTGEVTFRKSM